MTNGQKAVGLSDHKSPVGNQPLYEAKELYAKAIDLLLCARASAGSEAARLYSTAITDTQTACLWAEKALTYHD